MNGSSTRQMKVAVSQGGPGMTQPTCTTLMVNGHPGIARRATAFAVLFTSSPEKIPPKAFEHHEFTPTRDYRKEQPVPDSIFDRVQSPVRL